MKPNSLILKIIFIYIIGLFVVIGCTPKQKEQNTQIYKKGTFGYDAEFLSKYQETILLKNGKAQLLVCPAYQGRVMTSTSDGMSGLSYGWLNYNLIKSGKFVDKINAFGGEDRFWIGPEGGQFSIFFKKGDPFNLDTWQTPAQIDSEPFNLIAKSEKNAVFAKEFKLTNYSGNEFNLKVDREISLLSVQEASKLLSSQLPQNINIVAYQSNNKITNTGDTPWTKETGALSIWILGMFNPTPNMTIVIPFKQGDESDLGPIVNDTYFGKVPAERLIIGDGVLYFKGDGQYRSKIGLNPKRALPVMGSYDADSKVLTIVHYTITAGISDYVNSMWEIQERPFAGDAVNSYNDGPVDGNALGPFYELESSSPAAFLDSGQNMNHKHTTIHIQGDELKLDKISRAVLGVPIDKIKGVFE